MICEYQLRTNWSNNSHTFCSISVVNWMFVLIKQIFFSDINILCFEHGALDLNLQSYFIPYMELVCPYMELMCPNMVLMLFFFYQCDGT